MMLPFFFFYYLATLLFLACRKQELLLTDIIFNVCLISFSIALF